MSYNDKPIHLAELGICHREPRTEPYCKVEICLRQSGLDGLNNLIRFLEGLERGGNAGQIPGAFELVMHYRELRAAICAAEDVKRKAEEEGAP